MWTRSVPYSLLNSDVLETIVSKCGVWTQPYQTRWYQYSPGKLGYNNYDKEYSGDVGYPWPTDFDSWTGTCCQAFVYNCAKKVGYNFTSDENYRNEVTLWATLGTQIEYYEVQRGDIVYFEGGYHVGIVLTPDHSNPNNTVILQALGEYQSPFYFQVSTATVGQTIQVYIGTQPNPVFRRLPQQ
jgi:cell wall-associated NlpC family hydrolase